MSEPISKDCKHCEHLTARWEDTAGEHKRWQCCHCGRIRSEYAPISRGFGDVWETGGHGPFLSQPRFAELKTGTPEAGVREARSISSRNSSRKRYGSTGDQGNGD